ncbi:MAG: PilZ domain-containing protein [Proteobacteria bacterium]|nr:PilZ domain-containing protein [Pseudomonadota bacterium]
MTSSGHRRSHRIEFTSAALLRYGDNGLLEARVDTRDISLHGVMIKTDSRLPIATPCTVELHLSGATSEMDVVVQGVIQRHEDTGMAVAFTHLDPDSFLHILNLVKLHEAE